MRSTYIITPLIATSQFNIKELNIKGAEELGFDSDSMSDLIRHKCAMDQGFVRRFRLEREGDDKKLAIKESYLFNASVQQITDYIMQDNPTIEMWTGRRKKFLKVEYSKGAYNDSV